MFDVNFILDNYGLSGCFVEIVFLELVNAFLLRDAVADPCPLVTIMYGSLVEAGGTLAGKAAELLFEKHLDESYFTLACATVSGLVTVLGIHLTGMYGNPIVAWACTFNCGQVSHVAHFVVYWVAPLAAWQIADRYLHEPSAVKVD
ncbi:AQP-9 protein [Aphelenchoides avenae]|nr:AQP-9 protein [Aphelenchus avenae]